jgi:hypothetical protein
MHAPKHPRTRQDFEKPFDSPAILVVGHQTDGKSALVEALLGFQFNDCGGGTKTRRPITLHMKYCSAAVQPNFYLSGEEAGAGEREVTLEELQVGLGGCGWGVEKREGWGVEKRERGREREREGERERERRERLL